MRVLKASGVGLKLEREEYDAAACAGISDTSFNIVDIKPANMEASITVALFLCACASVRRGGRLCVSCVCV